jgi:hypothetical protein
MEYTSNIAAYRNQQLAVASNIITHTDLFTRRNWLALGSENTLQLLRGILLFTSYLIMKQMAVSWRLLRLRIPLNCHVPRHLGRSRLDGPHCSEDHTFNVR